MEDRFIRVRSLKDIIIFTSLIIIGLALAVMPVDIGYNLAGYTLIVIGFLLGCFLKSNYKDIETQKEYLKKELSFSADMKTPILSALKTTPASIDISKNGKGQVLILKLYYGKVSQNAYLQLFEYIPHQYEPCSEIYEYDRASIENLLK